MSDHNHFLSPSLGYEFSLSYMALLLTEWGENMQAFCSTDEEPRLLFTLGPCFSIYQKTMGNIAISIWEATGPLTVIKTRKEKYTWLEIAEKAKPHCGQSGERKRGHSIKIKSGTQEEKKGKLQRWQKEDMTLEMRSSQNHKNYLQQKVAVDKIFGNKGQDGGREGRRLE